MTPPPHPSQTGAGALPPSCDAVVVGSGPNGLVAANLLADAGWSVVVVEAQPRAGGAVASDDDVRPGFVHDTFSSFYPLAAVSPTIRGLGLEQHGLEWVAAPAVVGTPLPGDPAPGTDGWSLLHPQVERTAAALDAHHPGDGEAWLRMCAGWDRVGEDVVGALLRPFPPVRHGLRAAAHLRGAGGLDLVRDLLGPVRTMATAHFGGLPAQQLLAGNAAHADVPVDAPGSAVMGWLLAMIGQDLGWPVPRGGAGRLSAALVQRFEDLGGTLVTGCRVDRVVVDGGRAVAVRVGDREVRARRAVVADVAAPALYGDLVPWDDLPPRMRGRMRSFTWDPGTIKVDWALSGPVPWRHRPAADPGTVHLLDDLDGLARMQGEVAAGLVPSDPFLLVGQMEVADPSRAPAGSASLWAYTHVPQVVRGDAGAERGAPEVAVRGTWDHDDAERMADRLQARIERDAPGFTDRVLARRVLGPRELQERDENLVGGALNGGTAGLQQQLVFRPVAGSGRPETPVAGLYLASASAHPGGGVHGAPGSNAARAALLHDRLGLPGRAVRGVTDQGRLAALLRAATG